MNQHIKIQKSGLQNIIEILIALLCMIFAIIFIANNHAVGFLISAVLCFHMVVIAKNQTLAIKIAAPDFGARPSNETPIPIPLIRLEQAPLFYNGRFVRLVNELELQKILPDIKEKQLDGYELRVQNKAFPICKNGKLKEWPNCFRKHWN